MVYNFSWIVPDMVAGMAWPRPGAADWLERQGVKAVLSLTEQLPPAIAALQLLHLPIPDMTSPSLSQILSGVEFMRGIVELGGGVVAQCAAGLGRTGTFLAAYLVSDGMAPAQAIGHVRLLRPGSVETPEQERAVFRYAELIGREEGPCA